ncbi:MAG TPA: RNA-binding protein, partial [Thermoplasmata archaeon]|nr:RNA-binding protein [Thermoplasmata archaeon]
VVPGQRLGTSEEFIGGPGTYEEDGAIYAQRAGVLDRDLQERTVSVVADGPEPGPPRKGDVVVGMVSSIKSSMALVEILHCLTNPRAIITEEYAILHISKVERGYLRDFSASIAPGDLIKAAVIADHPEIKLRINSPELGVIKAQCPVCGNTLERRKGGVLRCLACEADFRRKVSKDYLGG